MNVPPIGRQGNSRDKRGRDHGLWFGAAEIEIVRRNDMRPVTGDGLQACIGTAAVNGCTS